MKPKISSPAQIMGILNLTPDSFSDGGLFNTRPRALSRVKQLLDEGADVIDIGGYSSRPGAPAVSVHEEHERVYGITKAIRRRFPGASLSIDTSRASIADELLGIGVGMVNDISGARDPEMLTVVAKHKATYLTMHMQGTPKTMQRAPYYTDVVAEVSTFLASRITDARASGVSRLYVDPGFGFGKSLEHNYKLLANLRLLSDLGAPLAVGLSRKSMLWRPLGADPSGVIAAVSAAHLFALRGGARLLRVHDVAAAHQVRAVYERLCQYEDLGEGDGCRFMAS